MILGILNLWGPDLQHIITNEFSTCALGKLGCSKVSQIRHLKFLIAFANLGQFPVLTTTHKCHGKDQQREHRLDIFNPYIHFSLITPSLENIMQSCSINAVM